MKKIMVILLILSVNTGCKRELNRYVIEDISPVLYLYINQHEDQLEISTYVPPMSEESKTLIKTESNLLGESTKIFNAKHYRQLEKGQVRIILFDVSVAKEEMFKIVSLLNSDPDITQRLYLIVTSGNIIDAIGKNLEENPKFDYYFYSNLLHFEKVGGFTVTNIYQFMSDIYNDYSDPVTSYFEAEGNNISYGGTALYKDGEYIDHLDLMEDQYFQILHQGNYVNNLVLNETKTTLHNVKINSDWNISKDQKKLSLHLKLKGTFYEYAGDLNLNKEENLKKFKEQVIQEMEMNIKNLIEKFQKLNIDPLNIGLSTVPLVGKPMNNKEWYEKFRKMHVQVDVDLTAEFMENINAYKDIQRND